MQIAILGATGGIGGHVLDWALRAGHPVHALARDPQAWSRRSCRGSWPSSSPTCARWRT